MASRYERLCMAIIKNSKIKKIAKDFGDGTANAAECQWRRVKIRFEIAQPKGDSDTSLDVKPRKAKASKKRGMEEISPGEEEKIVRKQPAKKNARGRKVEMEETPETEIGGEILQDDVDEF